MLRRLRARLTGTLLCLALTGMAVLAQEDAAVQGIKINAELTLTLPTNLEVESAAPEDDVFVIITDPETQFFVRLYSINILGECDVSAPGPVEPEPPACNASSAGVLPYQIEGYEHTPDENAEGVTESFDAQAGDAALYMDSAYGLFAGALNLGNGNFLILITWNPDKLSVEYRETMLRQVINGIAYEQQPPAAVLLPFIERPGCDWAVDTGEFKNSWVVMARGSDDSIYVHFESKGVVILGEDGEVRRMITGAYLTQSRIEDMLVQEDGSMVMALNDSSLNLIDGEGNFEESLTPGFGGITQVETDSEGKLYFLDVPWSDSGIAVLVQTPDGEISADFKIESDQFQIQSSEPFLLEAKMGVSPDGIIYVSPDPDYDYDKDDYFQQAIRVFDSTGKVVMPAFGNTAYARAIGFDAAGRVYVFGGGVQVYTPEGELIAKVTLEEMTPEGGVVLTDGSIVFHTESDYLCRMTVLPEDSTP